MASLGHLVSNSLWFAFDALDQQKLGTVPKSQLKVLTQNIGVLLSIRRKVEDCIIDYLSVGQLSFEQYLYFLVHEVFAEVDDGEKSYKHLKRFHDCLDKAFWDICRPTLLSRHQPILSKSSVYKIFRIFCLLADRTSNRNYLSQVTLPKVEVEEVTRTFINELGREWDSNDFDEMLFVIPFFTLPVLLTFLEGRYLHDVEPAAAEAAIEELYQYFIEQVMEKGKMYQRLPWVPIWLTREIEVIQWEIKSSKSKEILPVNLVSSTLISLSPSTTVHNISECLGEKSCRITVCSEDKILQLAAPEHRSKSRWFRAINVAIQHSKEALPYQMLLSEARKEYRAVEEEKETEEKIRRASQNDIIEQTQAELMAEKIARAEAEASAREESAARANEEKRVEELINLRQELEVLLEQETQAKRDEEIVRNLQARVLREEWGKREELEKLQEEQRILLEEEKEKRKIFEKVQEEKDFQLNEAQKKLAILEKDRKKLDYDLRATREKIVMSERGKEILETRMKVKERTPPARTYSLRPVRRERRIIPVRSSSFNTQTSNNKEPFSKLPLQLEDTSETGSNDTFDDLLTGEICDSIENYKCIKNKTSGCCLEVPEIQRNPRRYCSSDDILKDNMPSTTQ